MFDRDASGHEPDDPAVRRFWTALIGPSAVADLLRLIAAAKKGHRVREPLSLARLTAEGLIERSGSMVLVRPLIPHLSRAHLRRLKPSLRVEYLTALEAA